MEKINSIGVNTLEDYELRDLEEVGFDFLVYDYENGGYEGSGFAAWKKGDNWFYHELGHCSCNGPMDNVQSSAKIPVTLEQVIALSEDFYSNGKNVAAYLKTNFLKVEPQELQMTIDQPWQREALETFFGSEDVYNVGHDGEDGVYEIELVLRRTGKKLV